MWTVILVLSLVVIALVVAYIVRSIVRCKYCGKFGWRKNFELLDLNERCVVHICCAHDCFVKYMADDTIEINRENV